VSPSICRVEKDEALLARIIVRIRSAYREIIALELQGLAAQEGRETALFGLRKGSDDQDLGARKG